MCDYYLLIIYQTFVLRASLSHHSFVNKWVFQYTCVDNMGAIFTSVNTWISQRIKHIDISHFLIQDYTPGSTVKIHFFHSEEKLVDTFTNYFINGIFLLDSFRVHILQVNILIISIIVSITRKLSDFISLSWVVMW